MKKIAVVFAGQGSQYPGMGRDLYEQSEVAKKIFDSAGEKIKTDCFNGTKEELRNTQITQPAVYTVDMAAWEALKKALQEEFSDEQRPEVVAMAGFSLGEYAAYTASGVIKSFEEGISLVQKRANLMLESGKHEDGTPRGKMAAVLGSADKIKEVVDRVRDNDVLEAVNFNAPTQTVIAGDEEAIARFSEVAKTNACGLVKPLKVLPLSVSTAFHSPIMAKASEGLVEAVRDMEFGTPNYELVINTTGRIIEESSKSGDVTSDDVREEIRKQVMSPVLWQTTTDTIYNMGIDTFIEIGPGKTLQGLAKKTIKGINAYHVQDMETLAETITALKQ